MAPRQSSLRLIINPYESDEEQSSVGTTIEDGASDINYSIEQENAETFFF